MILIGATKRMVIDSLEQQAFLLEMFKAVNIPGVALELAHALKKAIESAEIRDTTLPAVM